MSDAEAARSQLSQLAAVTKEKSKLNSALRHSKDKCKVGCSKAMVASHEYNASYCSEGTVRQDMQVYAL